MPKSQSISNRATDKHPIDVLAESTVTEERIVAYRQLAEPERLIEQDSRFGFEELIRGIREEYSPLARMAAAGALGSYPKPETIEALKSAGTDPDPNVRQEVCKSLGRIGYSSSIEILGKIARTDAVSDVRLAAIEALSMTQGQEALPHLLEGLNDEDLLVSRASVVGLRIHTSQNFGDNYEQWAAYLKEKGSREAIADHSKSNPRR